MKSKKGRLFERLEFWFKAWGNFRIKILFDRVRAILKSVPKPFQKTFFKPHRLKINPISSGYIRFFIFQPSYQSELIRAQNYN